MDIKYFIDRVRVLCTKIINCDIDIDEYWKKWPEDLNGIPFFDIMSEDLEYAIEMSCIYRDSWEYTEYWLIVNMYLYLLEKENDFDKLKKCRNIILKEGITLSYKSQVDKHLKNLQ